MAIVKKLFTVALFMFFTGVVFAQNEANATAGSVHRTNMRLGNALDIKFTKNGILTGPVVNMDFARVNDYANGVESPVQEINIRTNKNFKIVVNTSAANFTYTGNISPPPLMPVSGVLELKIAANTTNGKMESSFSSSSFHSLTETAQPLLSNCSSGSGQAFGVVYKATPGFVYPAGVYTIDVIYTATQI